MDGIFGVGLPEVVVILVIAGMVMGPERIARAARSLGVLTARLQAVSRSFFRQLNAELDNVDESGELRSTVEELNQLRRQVADLRNEVISITTGAAAEGQQAISDIKRETENAIMPPDLKPRPKLLRPTPAATSTQSAASTPSTASTQSTASSPQPPAADDGPVYRPPSLFSDEPAAPDANGHAAPPPAAPRPRRIDIPEDPD